MARKNWAALMNEFVSRDCSLEEFAIEKKISINTMTKHSSKEKWFEKRQNLANAVEVIALDAIADNRADLLLQQNQRDLDFVARAESVLLTYLKRDDLKPQDIKALISGKKDLQTIARIALGADIGNIEMKIDADFESWINERTITIENQQSA